MEEEESRGAKGGAGEEMQRNMRPESRLIMVFKKAVNGVDL